MGRTENDILELAHHPQILVCQKFTPLLQLEIDLDPQTIKQGRESAMSLFIYALFKLKGCVCSVVL